MSDVDRVTLRPVEPADAPRLERWRAEESIRRHQPLVRLSARRLRADISSRHHQRLADARGERFDWVIQLDGEPVGWITLVVHSWEHGLAECGYAMSTPFQGRGVMSRALERFLDHVFSTGVLHRVEARCSVDNLASQRVLDKLGFCREGLLRSYFALDGGRVDNYLYAVLRSDWEARGRGRGEG